MSATEVITEELQGLRTGLNESHETIGEIRECIRRMEFLIKVMHPEITDGITTFKLDSRRYEELSQTCERAERIVR